MIVLIYDGSMMSDELVVLFHEDNLPYIRIVDNDFNDLILLNHYHLNEYSNKVQCSYYDYEKGKQKTVKKKLSDILCTCELVIFHTGWVVKWQGNEIDACDLILEKIPIPHKIIVTGDDTKIFSSYSYVQWKGGHGDLRNKVRNILNGCLTQSPDEKIRRICAEIKENTEHEQVILEILESFLALDVDMQALSMLAEKKNKEKQVKELKTYLQKMLTDNTNYSNKYTNLKNNLDNICRYQSIDRQSLLMLCNKVEHFLTILQVQASATKPSYEKLRTYDWGIKGISSFHDWYCKLSDCLMTHEK